MFMTFVANSGTYEVSGSSLTTKPVVALGMRAFRSTSSVSIVPDTRLEHAKLEVNRFAAPAPESSEDDPLRASYHDSLVPFSRKPK